MLIRSFQSMTFILSRNSLGRLLLAPQLKQRRYRRFDQGPPVGKQLTKCSLLRSSRRDKSFSSVLAFSLEPCSRQRLSDEAQPLTVWAGFVQEFGQVSWLVLDEPEH